MRYIIIAAVIAFGVWYFLGRNKLPRDVTRIGEDFALAKNRWAAGGWSREDAGDFLNRLHQDALAGAKSHPQDGKRKEAAALANEIVQWTISNVR
jgi:hypothetical protein